MKISQVVFRGVYAATEFGETRESVLEMLQRCPCTIDDIAGGLGIHHNEALKHVEKFIGDRV